MSFSVTNGHNKTLRPFLAVLMCLPMILNTDIKSLKKTSRDGCSLLSKVKP